jgi:uncharacterized membrane protein
VSRDVLAERSRARRAFGLLLMVVGVCGLVGAILAAVTGAPFPRWAAIGDAIFLSMLILGVGIGGYLGDRR